MEPYASHGYGPVIAADDGTNCGIPWQLKGHYPVHYPAPESHRYHHAHRSREELIIHVTRVDEPWGHHHCGGPISGITG